ncbi:hypothetical protein [Bradyrhizobium sp. 27S5]|uniref:hypothetical protein n=1 Tax=Bradyrhizobium sp. 27S5 TaxID=3139728 RepID=UPI0030D3D50A
MIDDDFDDRLAALKQNATEADELACALCDLEGGDAEVEGAEARCDVFRWVWSLPKFNKAARRKLFVA